MVAAAFEAAMSRVVSTVDAGIASGVMSIGAAYSARMTRVMGHFGGPKVRKRNCIERLGAIYGRAFSDLRLITLPCPDDERH